MACSRPELVPGYDSTQVLVDLVSEHLYVVYRARSVYKEDGCVLRGRDDAGTHDLSLPMMHSSGSLARVFT